MAKYQRTSAKTSKKSSPVGLTLDQLVLEGAKRLVVEALENEISECVGRQRYERQSDQTNKMYRNGYGKERHLTVGCGTFPLRVPRLREPFESQIVKRYQRCSDQIGDLFPQLYLHGLATGDFEPCFAAVLGEHAPLSPASIARMKASWKDEYERWKKRSLDADYLYVWVDGVYPKAGPKDEDMAVLVVLGVTRKGRKELLALEEGYRESYESWRDVFRHLKKRGVRWIGLVTADGLPGVWRALRDVFPHTRRQRCWVHKMRNILDKVPTKAYDEVRQALREMYNARSKTEAIALKKAFIQRYRTRYPKAVKSLGEAGDLLFTYLDFPKPHRRSLKTTNPIESLFAVVKLRTDAARRIPKRESALYFVFQLLTNQQQKLKRIRGYKLITQTIDHMKEKSKKRKVA